jgi:hypothetical protein
LKTIGADDFDFANARGVVSSAQKFVVPVGRLPDAEPLLYPPGTARAGEKITDWEGKIIGETGIVFYNAVDKCHQAVPADGQSVIIFNEVDSRRAQNFMTFIRALGGGAIFMSKASILSIIRYAAESLGLVDIYNSTDVYVRAYLAPIGDAAADRTERPFGWMRRNREDVCHAMFAPGPALFKGPAATPQQIPPCGAFILRQGAEFRMIETSAMLRTYMNPDCSPLDLGSFNRSKS